MHRNSSTAKHLLISDHEKRLIKINHQKLTSKNASASKSKIATFLDSLICFPLVQCGLEALREIEIKTVKVQNHPNPQVYRDQKMRRKEVIRPQSIPLLPLQYSPRWFQLLYKFITLGTNQKLSPAGISLKKSVQGFQSSSGDQDEEEVCCDTDTLLRVQGPRMEVSSETHLSP